MDTPRAATEIDSQRRPLHFRRRHRLSGSRAFQTVYDVRVRKSRGPLTVFARPNDLEHPRLGLSVSRRVGNASARNVIKRRLREAFRLLQHDHARPLDLIINVAPHQPATVEIYRQLLHQAWAELDREWVRRARCEESGQ